VAGGLSQPATYIDMCCICVCFQTSGWLLRRFVNVPTEVVMISDAIFLFIAHTNSVTCL
jgi:hypothetical protein